MKHNKKILLAARGAVLIALKKQSKLSFNTREEFYGKLPPYKH